MHGPRLLTNPGLLMVLGLLLGLRLVLRGPRLPGLGIRLGSGTGAVLTTKMEVLPPMWRARSSCLWFEVVRWLNV